MWLFSQRGFFSIIHKDEQTLTVRARLKGDIEAYWPNANVIITPDKDYRYRADIPRIDVINAVGFMVADINYNNFKNSINDKKRRSEFYEDVWMTMMILQVQEEKDD